MQENEKSNTKIVDECVDSQVKISVRTLVEFVLRSGNIDNKHRIAPDNAMQEGGRIHRMIQKKMGSDYKSEVSLKYVSHTELYSLFLEGRADGIIEKENEIIIDEIKSTHRDVAFIGAASPLHIAQAKCYAYMYAFHRISCNGQESMDSQILKIRITYCNVITEEIKYFYETLDMEELKHWFGQLLASYKKWADFEFRWRKKRDESIEQMEFPFAYRNGQKELVSYVYQTIYHRKKLFLEAPTGVGKTITTIFPAIKAMPQGMCDKIFYFTAKTITRTVADNTFHTLREQGLLFKSIILTAKEKICFMEETECNPEFCQYARGHFDRINDAVYELLQKEDRFTREVLEEYAYKHRVCPFEMGLDVSLYCDGIIGDYNYLFDPHVYLKRFFSEGTENNYTFLIDEAHNLLERGREMYSATLIKEELMNLKKEVNLEIKKGKNNETHERKQTALFVKKGFAYKIEKNMERVNKEMLALKRKCEGFCVVEEMEPLIKSLLYLQEAMEQYLEEQEEVVPLIKEQLLEYYFVLCHFIDINELVDSKYTKYTQITEEGQFLVKLFCVDPSNNLKKCMFRGRSSILFSATFLPIQYYKALLGGESGDYEVYAESIFDSEKRALFIAEDVTSKYTRRSESEFHKIAGYINEIVSQRHGNYMVFFPSYSFMHAIFDMFQTDYAEVDKVCIKQSTSMKEEERESFLNAFEVDTGLAEGLNELEHTLIGFCVLGGIFSEGIDLKKDSLIGVIIVGTGIPQVCDERELLKEYFNERQQNGYDYSYCYPGMNKVLQAAGRVIRTVDDIGIIVLLDERFLHGSYQKLFPREWRQFEIVKNDTIAKRIEKFWNSWL